jgi:hypothetical protein
MKWLRWHFRKQEPKTAQPPGDTDEDKERSEFHLTLLSIRYEILIVLMARWPTTETDLENWDKVAEKAKKDQTNPISAGLSLNIAFNPGFWRLMLSNISANLESIPLSYLESQARVFHMDGPERSLEEEAAQVCNVLVSLKRISGYGPNQPFQIADCRAFLALAEALPPTEDPQIFKLLAFIALHTIIIDEYLATNSGLDFWQRLVSLNWRAAESTGNASNIAFGALCRALVSIRQADQDSTLQSNAFQFCQIVMDRLGKIGNEESAPQRRLIRRQMIKRPYLKALAI